MAPSKDYASALACEYDGVAITEWVLLVDAVF
jgi:hypothetical protein